MKNAKFTTLSQQILSDRWLLLVGKKIILVVTLLSYSIYSEIVVNVTLFFINIMWNYEIGQKGN